MSQPPGVGVSEYTNQLLEAILAKVSQILNIIAVDANAPPQYTGPTTINDLVVGQGRALQGFDPDGDTIIWSIDPADEAKATVTTGGILTAIVPLNGPITVWLDDGKT
jgi:hypothetical protein